MWSSMALVVMPIGGAVVAIWLWLTERRRRVARQLVASAPPSPVHGRVVSTFPPRYRWAPLVVAVMTAMGTWGWLNWPVLFALAAAAIVGVIGMIAESIVASKRVLLLETQLTDIIDGLVGSLRVGMALPKAIEVAMQESKDPLRSYLEDLVARLRLGEDAPSVFRDLSRRIPLDGMQLFALTLSAQWAGGGRVASSLAAVGRTIRDRIEVSRRVQAQAVEANVSVIAMMGISYGLAWIMWRANPASFVMFLTSDLGRYLTAGTMLLQAVGIVWVRQLSRIRY
ncbi:MAG: type II secretion system F family protein [Nitrospira sp.]|nr:type II secretion system F family protein [Nitrospira sp.]